MTGEEWRAAILAVREPPKTVKAITFLKAWSTASQPAAVSCDDGVTYVAKGSQNGRMCFNDHVVNRLGALIDAPVGQVVFVDAADLVRIEPRMSHFGPALAHGTRELPDCGERQAFEYSHVAENRGRFGALCILYSWAGCWGDHQMIYENSGVHLAHSVDHGHFFPGGPNWTTAGLQATPAAVLDAVFGQCGLVEAELVQTKQRLRAVTEQQLASILAAPPEAWGVAMQERVAMAEYLVRRKIELVGTP